MKKSFIFTKCKAGPSSDGPYCGHKVVQGMKCSGETPEDNQKQKKDLTRYTNVNRSGKEATKEQLSRQT